MVGLLEKMMAGRKKRSYKKSGKYAGRDQPPQTESKPRTGTIKEMMEGAPKLKHRLKPAKPQNLMLFRLTYKRTCFSCKALVQKDGTNKCHFGYRVGVRLIEVNGKGYADPCPSEPCYKPTSTIQFEKLNKMLRRDEFIRVSEQCLACATFQQWKEQGRDMIDCSIGGMAEDTNDGLPMVIPCPDFKEKIK